MQCMHSCMYMCTKDEAVPHTCAVDTGDIVTKAYTDILKLCLKKTRRLNLTLPDDDVQLCRASSTHARALMM